MSDHASRYVNPDLDAAAESAADTLHDAGEATFRRKSDDTLDGVTRVPESALRRNIKATGAVMEASIFIAISNASTYEATFCCISGTLMCGNSETMNHS